ncbi:hypothetical protein AVEN_39491-1 [Araneus ventricosus]|uniref:Uncharacterized protein n=1 Tax=Araneus ventricosus TaxID=182803 RepID=A0A4Y2D615_ARAVE|nr:hypothetical protein AVEN_39491-1 [Araneus ventricosus]
MKENKRKEEKEEKEENVVLMEESEYEDFVSFQQEMEDAEMEEVIYLESSIVDFSTNLFFYPYCWRYQNEVTLFVRLQCSRS